MPLADSHWLTSHATSSIRPLPRTDVPAMASSHGFPCLAAFAVASSPCPCSESKGLAGDGPHPAEPSVGLPPPGRAEVGGGSWEPKQGHAWKGALGRMMVLVSLMH